MDYFRDKNNQIQADFAFRIGEIAKTYHKSAETTQAGESFDVTLHICLMQSLVTSCSELTNSMAQNDNKRLFFKSKFSDIPSLWGLRSSMVSVNTFCSEQVSYEDVIRHLRNALSHPNFLDLSSNFPSTGFDSIKSVDGSISKVTFIHSPDVSKNAPKHFTSMIKARNHFTQNNGGVKSGFPTQINVTELSNSKYVLIHNNLPFARIFRIDIPVDNLKQFVIGLSSHLSIPAQPNWENYLREKEIARMEEVALARAVEDSKNSGTADRDEVFAVFDKAA